MCGAVVVLYTHVPTVWLCIPTECLRIIIVVYLICHAMYTYCVVLKMCCVVHLQCGVVYLHCVMLFHENIECLSKVIPVYCMYTCVSILVQTYPETQVVKTIGGYTTYM